MTDVYKYGDVIKYFDMKKKIKEAEFSYASSFI